MVAKSRKHARKVTLDAAVNNAIEKAVDARKVAAFTVGAAGVLAGAAFAFGATPAMAADAGAASEPAKAPVTTDKKSGTKPDDKDEKKEQISTKKDSEQKNDAKNEQKDGQKNKIEANAEDSNKIKLTGENNKTDEKTSTDSAPVANDPTSETNTPVTSGTPVETPVETSTPAASSTYAASSAPAETTASTVPQGQDRADTEHNPNEIVFSKNLPNIYGWATPSNTFDEKLEKQEIVYHLPPNSDGKTVARVVILPDSKDSINTDDSSAYKKIIEYDSARVDEMHQSYSGIYELRKNGDGSKDLIMKQPFRDGGISSGQGYCANRSIFLYYDENNLQHDQTSNNFRVATLVPPKTAGSIVLKYNESLSADKVREVLHKAVNLPTEHKSGSSVAEQLVAQSKSAGVGLRVDESTVNNTPDTVDAKIPQSMGSYDEAMFGEINKRDDNENYSFGERKLKTYLVTDLGMKSPEIPLTVVRYSTRIEKPVVDTVDFSKLTEDQKAQIKKNLAKLNGVSTDKVKFDNDGNAIIDFDGLSPQDDPKIPLSDLVLTRVAVGDVVVPTGDKAVFVANPLGYSSAELDRIKTAIYEANKDNEKLGLSEKDYKNQISLEYVKGDTVIGHENIGISNGQAENIITVKIKTDKAFAKFTSNVKESKLTKLPNIRKDYTVSWTKTKIDGRDTDEGISWSNDQKTTIIYRYDPTRAEEFDTTKILGLLKATPNDTKSGLRELTGGEQLEYEGTGNNARKSHMHYVLQKGEPTTELTLGNMNGAYWYGVQKVSNSDVKLGDAESEAGSYSWDTEAGPVKVAGKKGKIFKARLFVEPYAMSYYKDVYLEKGRHPGNTAKAINVIFVPQTNHKTSDLKTSVDEHKTTTVDNKEVPTVAAYYNASKDKKDAYDKALDAAKETLKKVGTTADADLSEDLKAEVDNATINLKNARAALDGDATKKEELNKSIKANGKAAEGDTAATPGTVTTDKYKNVTEPDFKKADGSDDTERNEAAKKAKEAYDKALEEAKKVKDNTNATQTQVDDAKAKLDEARKKLNDFTTNKDELNNAIAQHGKVNTGDSTKTDPNEKLKTADPTYQNSTPDERTAYDNAVKKANDLSKDPNASQKDVNEAIKKLKDAKDALDKNATDKAPLDSAVQKTLDNPDPNDPNKHSVFYTNAKAKTNDPDAQQAIKNYDDALAEAKRVLGEKNATNADVEKAKKDLEDAEKVLYADKYQTKSTDLAEAIADNVSGYLMPAYFNAFDLSQSKNPADTEKAKQAAKDFKAYNDAYHAAKDLLKEIKNPDSTVTQDQANKVKDKLIEARKAIDKYATDTSKISAALLHSLAITNSPAYKNASAGAAGSEEAKAKQAYDDALEKLKKAFNDEMPQDTVDGKPDSAVISTDNVPVKDGDTSSPDYLKNIQSHAKGQPLNRDVPKLLADLNKAVADLNKFATKTDKLQESINKDTDTQKDPAYKNTKDPHKLGDNGQEDTSGYETVKQKAKDYDDALTEAKKLLTDPTATQAQVDEALKKLDDARKALKDQDTNVEALKKSVGKHGTEKQGETAATEGTVTSDAYRNASDPHFMKEQDGKLVPDDTKNNAAKEAKKAYDKALAEAQELLSKHDNKDTPLDAKPTQKQIDAALTELNKKRKALDDYKTNVDALKTEADKSKADTAQTVGENDFENTTEFKNADVKKGKDNKDNDDVDAYKKALKAARDLLSKKDATNLSERPTQQQIDDALETLKKAKQAITDGYKTDATALQDEATLGEDDGAFTKSPEYKNAEAKKAEGSSDNAKLKAYKDALADVKTMLSKFGKDGKPKANATDIPTQDQVDSALDKLSKARKAVEDKYKTDVKPLEKEVGDKDKDDKPVIPPFEESIPYKNALYKKQSETGDAATSGTSATKKLQDYNDKFEAAKKIIDQVNNPDPNAEVDKRPTNADVKKALDELQEAKKAIADGFKTNAKDLKDEAAKSTADGATSVGESDFENTAEFKNALAKKGDSKEDIPDVKEYKKALKKARTLLNNFDKDGKLKSDAKEIPTQQEIDEALQKLKEIKDKITADYKTSSTELQQEVDKSKYGDNDKRDDVFENTPAFKNATAKGDDASKQALKEYNEKLAAAKKILEKFDRTTGKPKDDLPTGTTVPTQKELYDALDALQAAKKKIEDDYSTSKSDLRHEAGDDFAKSPEYQNAQAKGDDESKQALDEYKKALDEANSVLNDPNATQAEVDAALKRLQDAKSKLKSENSTDKSKLQAEADDDANFRKSVYFIIGNKADIDAYEDALAEANRVLADPNATQAEVDAALKKLEEAKKRILDFLSHFGGSGNGTGDYGFGEGTGFVNGHESYGALVDKTALQIEVNNAVETNANTAEAVAYRQALAEARSVLNNPNATQAQVDAALRKLAEAKAALLNSLSGASGHKIAKTGAATGLFAGFAVIFAGLGAAGVASRRRKHSNE
ncbi:peptidase [Gardnerella greenwoodii]|uniref:peptidase n=1 Tax=Gardnerella greenwoodii TaxID=2914925 RepID=UPI0039EE17D8